MFWETTEGMLLWLVGAPLRIAVILVGAVVLRWLVHRAIAGLEERTVDRSQEREGEEPSRSKRDRVAAARRRQRALTLGSLLRSVSTFGIAVIATLTVMAEVGLPLGPLLASAGVGGLAIGFGAQTLVRDFLSGIFMIVEDQYGVGDYIDTGEATGVVEEVSLRVTRLRDYSGVVWFVRNGEIVRVGNQSQGWSMAAIDIPVSYDEEPDRVLTILRRVVQEVFEDPEWQPKLLEEPSVAGVESVSGGVMTLRVFAKCRPGEQWAVPREVRERAKEAFDAEGIRGPRIMPFDQRSP
ncbi:mechanosensitive ion channel family protein [Ornithinicoccus halotolerans]|uniref:mechanosensitive ion channel family protein n=1 Tax=Ornithinicoccus halotolerans TaxID=1748220 RepID=UPI001296829D|nr:mechanosensitive ion channel family protein [Ornithinicoccus halotolerans]